MCNNKGFYCGNVRKRYIPQKVSKQIYKLISHCSISFQVNNMLTDKKTANNRLHVKEEVTAHITHFSKETLHYTVVQSEAWPWNLENGYPRKLVQQFDVHVTVYRDKFLIINQPDALISQIYFEMKFHVFRTVPLSIIRSFLLYTQH